MFKSVDYTGTFTQGCGTEEDPHPCDYCLTKFLGWPISHKPRLMQQDDLELLKVRDCVVFLDSVHDGYAPVIPDAWIRKKHRWIGIQDPSITFYIQSKWISRALQDHLADLEAIKDRVIMGTTITSNRVNLVQKYSRAPPVDLRARSILEFSRIGFKTRLSLEPYLSFDPDILINWIVEINPELVEVGLDNYNHRHKLNMPIPSRSDHLLLKRVLEGRGIKVFEKSSIVNWLSRAEDNEDG